MSKDKIEKKGFANGRFHGYQFQEDNIANQMAFLFGGEEGENEAARIAREAEERYPGPLRMPERKNLSRKKSEKEPKR